MAQRGNEPLLYELDAKVFEDLQKRGRIKACERQE